MTHTAHKHGSSLSITASFTYEDRDRRRRCWTATGMLYYGSSVTRRQIMDDMWRQIEDGFWPQIDDIVFSLFAAERHIISWTPEHPAPDSGLPGSGCDFRAPRGPARYWRNPLEAHMPAIREALGLGETIEALRDLPADMRQARETGGWGRGISLEEAAPGIHLLLDMLGEGPAEDAIRALLADMGREKEQERAELARILNEGRPREKSTN